MTNWAKRKVLVTGGCGHIGSRIVKILLERKADSIKILDNLGAYEIKQTEVFGGEILGHDNVQLIDGDIANYDTVRKAVDDVDLVFHVAAYADVAACIRNPDESFRSNVLGTQNVLKASLKGGVQKYVFASSAAIYGDQPSQKPNEPTEFREDMKPNPLSTYANSKLWGENEAKLYYDLYGLQTVSLRYFSIYGHYQIPKRGSHSWVIAIFAGRAYRGQDLEIYGGEQVRDFIHVNEIAEATVRAAETNGVEGKAFNVGTGRPTKIKDLALMAKELGKEYFRKEVDIKTKPRPKGDPLGGYASTSKMMMLLNWKPTVSLEEHLRDYFQWVTNNPSLIPNYI